MRYQKPFLIFAILALSATLILWQLALAKPRPKPGNPGLPGCLAEVEELQGQIVAKDAEISDLQAEIDELNELVEQLQSQPPAPVPQTGQTESHYLGDDGDLQKGVECPEPRFTDNEDGTVTDNCTGLIWLRDANCMRSNYPAFDEDNVLGDGHVNWYHALDFVAGINAEIYENCGAGHTDWRVPNVRELLSLIDYRFNNPSIPNTLGTDQWTEGNPFSVEAGWYRYWSSTTWSNNVDHAWWVSFSSGFSERAQKDNVGDSYRVWPVRGGN
jgi:hypothetical protein